jgi:transcriptional regulator with XRE-family HTH domain
LQVAIMLIMDGEFGRRMKLALELAEMTQAELARAIGVSKSAVNKWCSDTAHESPAHAGHLRAAAQVMRVDFIWLVDGSGEPRPKQRLTTISLEAEDLARQLLELSSEKRAAVEDLIKAMR